MFSQKHFKKIKTKTSKQQQQQKTSRFPCRKKKNRYMCDIFEFYGVFN